ncbi:T9SS type A sorting domain-containing protein [Bacteroidota bacterium]
MKRIVLLVLVFVLGVLPLFACTPIFIPDTAFLNALIDEGVGTDENGEICSDEAESITKLDVSEKGISDMTGIESFHNLDTLKCQFNNVNRLVLMGISGLTHLNCEGNALTSLNVLGNPALLTLNCEGNDLTGLNVFKNPALLTLKCGGNNLPSLNISNNDSIRYLNLNEMPSLQEVWVWETFWTDPVHIDTTGSPNVYFTIYSSKDTVDIPDKNFLNALLENGVDINGDGLISSGEAEMITSLYIYGRRINDMTGIEAFVNLETLVCVSNDLYSLDVSDCTALTYLDCRYNSLYTLDVSNCSALTYLDCSFTNLVQLDVSNSTSLKTLNINHMEFLLVVYVWNSFPAGIAIASKDSPSVYFYKYNEGTGIVGIDQKGTRIYPNPVTDLLSIETSTPGLHTIEIHSLNGQLLYSTKIDGPTLQIDVSTFQKGVYLITIRSKDYMRTEKIIKL